MQSDTDSFTNLEIDGWIDVTVSRVGTAAILSSAYWVPCNEQAAGEQFGNVPIAHARNTSFQDRSEPGPGDVRRVDRDFIVRPSR